MRGKKLIFINFKITTQIYLNLTYIVGNNFDINTVVNTRVIGVMKIKLLFQTAEFDRHRVIT